MLILALDTAMSACSVALLRQSLDPDIPGKALAKRVELMQRGQSEALMPMIIAVMNEAGRSLSDVDLIAVTRGPGAFTGLRIGLAAARGLALALQCPCIGITTTQAVAEGVSDLKINDLLVVALDTKRADYYIQIFEVEPSTSIPESNVLVPTGPPCALLPELLSEFIRDSGGTSENITIVGDVSRQVCEQLNGDGLQARLSAASPFPDPVKITDLALRQWASIITRQHTADFNIADQPAPLYLRPPDAVIPKNGGRLRL